MAAVATQIMDGYGIRTQRDQGRGRSSSKPVPPNSREVSPLARKAGFPRSASYTYLPRATEPRSFSDADLIGSSNDADDESPPQSSGWTTPEEFEPKVPAELAQALIAELTKTPKISVSRLAPALDDDRSSIESSLREGSMSLESSPRTSSTSASKPNTSINNSFTRHVSRSPFYSAPSSPSRSPSPPKKETFAKSYQVGQDGAPTPPTVGMVRLKSLIRRKDSAKALVGDMPTKPPEALARRASALRRKVVRPVGGLFKGGSQEEPISAVNRISSIPQLPKSFSTNKLPTFKPLYPPERATPVPRLVSSERTVTSSGLGSARRKDELWSVFRALDGDHTKFQSKSSAFKANVVRSTLLPFLRMYASHPSNTILRPEDLDRRANILNRWWTGLIEMLHGRNNQSISGTDRPAILDGISGIMERPEWRLSLSPFCPLNQRMKGSKSPKNRSTSSLASSNSDFLGDCVRHNVRNIFIQNLSAQMAFIVDKMSLRNASASLVTFCGKACAYAFMFVPGMADVLVRLWEVPMDTLRRVLEENGIGKFENVADAASGVISSFPPSLQQLGFTSLTKYARTLRNSPALPLGTVNIHWWGYWLERWTGRESDLFYVFVKHFHILVTDFLSPEATKRERMCVPGLLLVHAQILANLESTIHRNAQSSPQDGPTPASPTFDDVFADPDAHASSTLPKPPSNVVRVMAEHRLIMLIRDFLSERTAEHPIARNLFAESFNDLLQASARKTSVFDHAACYTLLDFLEEALLILVRYEHLGDGEATVIQFDFWQNVCMKMISSQNTMTQIRLYAFLYTVWNTVVCDLGRKSDLCLGLLLDPDVFESQFYHWCPMVRAYFMRLLSWRIGRYDGEASKGDVPILETLHDRLRRTWGYYLWLREDAKKMRSAPPSTAPCNPAPCRRLMIIRTDTQVAPGGSFMSFDGIAPSHTPTAASLGPSWRRHSTLSQFTEMDTRPDTPASNADSEIECEPGVRGFFRNMLGSAGRSKSQPRVSTKQSLSAQKPIATPPQLTRSATEDFQQPHQNAWAINLQVKQLAQQTLHRNFCFKFSLEFISKTGQTPPQMRLGPPQLPMPAQHFLQSHSNESNSPSYMPPIEPTGESRARARYAGRALAEWMVVVGECQSFFERRKSEGVPGNKFVETPTLGVEVFRRPA